MELTGLSVELFGELVRSRKLSGLGGSVWVVLSVVANTGNADVFQVSHFSGLDPSTVRRAMAKIAKIK